MSFPTRKNDGSGVGIGRNLTQESAKIFGKPSGISPCLVGELLHLLLRSYEVDDFLPQWAESDSVHDW